MTIGGAAVAPQDASRAAIKYAVDVIFFIFAILRSAEEPSGHGRRFAQPAPDLEPGKRAVQSQYI
jgi:hypothetical protein